MSPIYTFWKQKKTKGFLVFSGGLKITENESFFGVSRVYKVGALAISGLRC